MATVDAGATVGELVAVRPSRSRVFEQFGIDYCCGGKQPLAAACAARNVALDEVVAALTEAEARGDGAGDADLTQMSLTELADHIEATHHAYLYRELPRLAALSAKVVAAHGERYPWVAEVDRVLAALRAELEMHLGKEEQILFPLCRRLDAAAGPLRFHCGSVANPIHVMESEHDGAATALEALDRLTNGYTAPDDACNTFRALLDGLRELELDLHAHIHKENSVLFPAAIALESQRG